MLPEKGCKSDMKLNFVKGAVPMIKIGDKKTTKIILMVFVSWGLFSCKSDDKSMSRLKWGIHNSARSANLLNLLPNQSVEVCAENPESIPAAHEAIQKWSSAIGRWGFFKIKECGQGADLRIDMFGYDATGLNYFSANPGKIYISSSSSGNFRKAIILHEYGHSFGLCDQYKDAGSANCSDDRSPRQENDEVMGATYPSKLQLTPGDIEGVRKAASSPIVPSTKVWQSFLANQSSTGGSDANSFFAMVVDGSSVSTPRVAVSVPQGFQLTVCAIGQGFGTCSPGSARQIPFDKVQPINGRDIYLSSKDIGGYLTSGQAQFEIVVPGADASNFKFQIKKR